MLALMYVAVGNKSEKHRFLSVMVRFTQKMSKTFKWKLLIFTIHLCEDYTNV